MIPKEKCGKCNFQDENKLCQNPVCLSYKERVLDGYIACYMFAPKQVAKSPHEALKPGKCGTCILDGKCRLNPEICPGTLDKDMSKVLMGDPSPVGSLFKKLVEDLMNTGRKI